MVREARRERSVVVPQPSAPHGVECLRSLGRRGVDTIAVSHSRFDPGRWSRYCDEAVAAPSPDEDLPGYAEALLSLAERSDVRTVLPTREADVYVLARRRDAFAEHVAALWPTLDVLRSAHDRLRLVDAAADAGVAVPETGLLGEVDAESRDVIVKPRFALLAAEYGAPIPSDECRRPDGTRYFPAGTAPDRDALRDEMGHDPIVQEYVRGRELSCRLLYDDGEPEASCMMYQHRGTTYAGGASVYRESTYDERLGSRATAVLDALDWHGVADVEFIRDEATGELVLTEVNPRFPSSVSMDVRAGADLPWCFWRVATDEHEHASGYETGVGTHDAVGEARYLASVLRDDYPLVEQPSVAAAASAVASSLVAQPRLDYLHADDPLPFLVHPLEKVA